MVKVDVCIPECSTFWNCTDDKFKLRHSGIGATATATLLQVNFVYVVYLVICDSG
jgi:hypothetical protein